MEGWCSEYFSSEQPRTIFSLISHVLVQKFKIEADDEDIHTANERRLSELIGPLGGKLHTGRSRNDQVATDMRLWLLDNVADIEESLKNFINVLVERADKEVEYIMPGYTHLQVCEVYHEPKNLFSDEL